MIKQAIKDCFSFWYQLYDVLLNSDEHHIVSQEGWRILNTLNRRELKEFIDKNKIK